MPQDVKVTDKAYYQPSTEPHIIEVPAWRFIAIDGAGDPNTSPTYAAAVEALYGLSYAIKMAHKQTLEYVVAPLEGLWELPGDFRGGGAAIQDKGQLRWTMMIRQPDFVTEEIFDQARAALRKKKAELDLSGARLMTYDEGLCVQLMHIGPYDAEPASVLRMDRFTQANGYLPDFEGGRRHHEIYLSDPRRTAPEKLRTALRHPVRRA